MPTRLPTSILLAAALALVANSAPAQSTSDRAGVALAAPAQTPYVDLTPADLRAMLDDDEVLLVNVHVPFEGDLPETDVSIPFDQVESHRASLPADRDTPIVLYCRSGRMSATAAAELARLGYTTLYNLAGGFNAWVAAGLPMAD